MEKLTRIPLQITAGDTVKWVVSLPDCPADTWAVSYALVKDGQQILFTSTADGSDHAVTLAAATTAAYEPGEYRYQAYAVSGAERVTVDSGKVTILPNYLAQTSGFDDRSWLDKSIEALEACIAGRASKTQLSQTIGGVQVQHMSPIDQLNLLNKLREQRSQADALARRKAGRSAGSTIRVRF